MALTFPSSPSNGQIYADTTTGNRYIYNATAGVWSFAANNVGMSVSSTPPSNVAPGAMWFNREIGRTFVYYDDGDSKQWIETVPAGAVDTNVVAGYVNPVFASMNGAYTTANAGFTKANNALANTSGTYFNGDLYFPSGSVGIGTTSPSTYGRLAVSSAAPHLGLNNPTGGSGVEIHLYDGGVFRHFIGHINNANHLQFGVGGTNSNTTWNGTCAMTIASDAKVGINTNAPSSYLHVVGPTSGTAAVQTIGRGSGSHMGSGLYIAGANYTTGSNAFLELNAGAYSGTSTTFINAYDDGSSRFNVRGDGTTFSKMFNINNTGTSLNSGTSLAPPSTGWVRIAQLGSGNGTSGGDIRAAGEITIQTSGGNFGPQTLVVRLETNWGGYSVNELSVSGGDPEGRYIRGFRITHSNGAYAYLEANIVTSALSGGSMYISNLTSYNITLLTTQTTGGGTVVSYAPPTDPNAVYRYSFNNYLNVSRLGYVTMPSQPSFFVRKSNGNVAVGNVIVYNDVAHNVGSGYSTSTGRFTAPIAGTYVFLAQTRTQGDVSRYITIRKNGSNMNMVVHENGGGASYYSTINNTIIMQLAQNDYVDVYVNASGSAIAFGGDTMQTTFSGQLIG